MSAPRHARTRLAVAMLLALGLSACAVAPAPVDAPVAEDRASTAVAMPPAEAPVPVAVPAVSEPVNAIENPPAPPPSASTPSLPTPEPTEASASAPPAATVAPTPSPAAPPVPPPPVPSPAVEPTDEQLVVLLVADLQRYATLSADELRREVGVSTQALTRQRSDANRIRLAVLYTLSRNPQDDQRALQLFDNVTRSAAGPVAIKQLAAVLQSQVAERVRAVREEQQKADAAVQKLEALRAMERSLLRDRIRSGGGGGGGGGGSGGGN